MNQLFVWMWLGSKCDMVVKSCCSVFRPRTPSKDWRLQEASSRPDFSAPLESRRTLFRGPAARPPSVRPLIAEQMHDYRAQLDRARLPRLKLQRPDGGEAVVPAAQEMPPPPPRPPPKTPGLRPVSEIPALFQPVFTEFDYFNKVCKLQLQN